MKYGKAIEQEKAYEEVFRKELPPRFYGGIVDKGLIEAR
jgi:hypothetical protein